MSSEVSKIEHAEYFIDRIEEGMTLEEISEDFSDFAATAAANYQTIWDHEEREILAQRPYLYNVGLMDKEVDFHSERQAEALKTMAGRSGLAGTMVLLGAGGSGNSIHNIVWTTLGAGLLTRWGKNDIEFSSKAAASDYVTHQSNEYMDVLRAQDETDYEISITGLDTFQDLYRESKRNDRFSSSKNSENS